MPIKIVELGKQFRPSTSHTYPPFKNGKYMEEFFYDFICLKQNEINTEYVYIPIFWTNLQNHPGFKSMRNNYNILLQNILKTYPESTKFFTVVQHDDGPQLELPKNTIVFGACTGTIPLPLIYEDTTFRLLNTKRVPKKDLLASFVGTYTTHKIRSEMFNELGRKKGIKCHVKGEWSAHVQENDASIFIDLTLRSKFCLAPRGYGRSSFRFFEAMLLDTVPVYFWDDIEWLPYKELLDYSKFSISIPRDNIKSTYEILSSITEEKYESMLNELKKVRYYFTLQGMCEYIISCI